MSEDTIKSAALWAWGNALQHTTPSALIHAIGNTIEAIPGDDDSFEDLRMIRDFSKRIATHPGTYGNYHLPSTPSLKYCGDWSGEWHVRNADLVTWGDFKMWLGRAHNIDTEHAFMTFADVGEALRIKRLYQAFRRYQSTGLRKEHCSLLANMGWEIDTDRGDWISLYVQGKRPFGNSAITYDIWEHAGLPMDWPEDDGMSDEQDEQAWELLDELVFAAPDAARVALKALP